jgi:hypothetical protein
MPVLATTDYSQAVPEREEPRIWIEHGDGSIARGKITVMGADTAIVWVAGASSIKPGDAVAVRVALRRDARTLGGSARVVTVRGVADGAECELRWTHSGPERDELKLAAAALR